MITSVLEFFLLPSANKKLCQYRSTHKTGNPSYDLDHTEDLFVTEP